MSLATLLEVPKTKEAWDRFSWNNKTACDRIRQAIQQQLSIPLTEYILDPIDLEKPEFFLENNAQAHIDFNNALGLQGADLEEVDLKDERQLTAWVFLNWKELNDASIELGV